VLDIRRLPGCSRRVSTFPQSGLKGTPQTNIFIVLFFFLPSITALSLVPSPSFAPSLRSSLYPPLCRLEGCLLSCPAVADAAVIGVWSEEQATELPRAYIVPSPDTNKETAAEDARKWIEAKLSNTKRLRGGVYLLEAIPKSPSGKILRKDLRALAAKEGQKSKL